MELHFVASSSCLRECSALKSAIPSTPSTTPQSRNACPGFSRSPRQSMGPAGSVVAPLWPGGILSLQPEPLDVVLHLIEASRHCPRRQWLWRECKNSNVLGIAGTNHWNYLQMGSPSDNCESKTPHLIIKIPIRWLGFKDQ